MLPDLISAPHKRKNMLTGEWVLVSPQRTQRPWQGKNEDTVHVQKIAYDPNCYLCATNIRMGGDVNPDYKDTFVFPNDFGAILPDHKPYVSQNGLLQAEIETGICKVVCFSSDHSLTLPDMEIENIEKVIDVWQKEYTELGNHPEINHVQIFENKGALMGCSNPHPHGQIWAQKSIPNEVVKKTISQSAYFNENGHSLLSNYIEQELKEKERIIFENNCFVSLVPFWAVWPFEVMIVPKPHMQHIQQLNARQKTDFAQQIKLITQKYDRLFDTSFPYSSGIHQAPTDHEHPEWHWHMCFYPPLLRSAKVKKFMVGYEMFGMPQRDITAEIAAKRLREV